MLSWWEEAFFFLFWSTVNSDFSASLTSDISISCVRCLLSHACLVVWVTWLCPCLPPGWLSVCPSLSLSPSFQPPITLSKGLLGMGDRAGPWQGVVHENRVTRYTGAGAARGLGRQGGGCSPVSLTECGSARLLLPSCAEAKRWGWRRQAGAEWSPWALKVLGFKSHSCQLWTLGKWSPLYKPQFAPL